MRLSYVYMIALCLFAQSSFAEGPALKRGVALHGPMTWGATDAAKKEYQLPVYADAKYDVNALLLTKVKKTGFDFIRLSVDPGPFMALSGEPRAVLDARLRGVIHTIREAGLDVIVDFHPIGMVAAYNPAHIESTGDDSMFPAYLAVVKQTAHLLAGESAHIAIEPMNEPQHGYNAREIADWQGRMEQLYHAVRSESPEMTIILTGGRGGSMEGLLNLDPTPFDKNTRYSFHYYLPYIFTHQGAAGTLDNPKSLPREYMVGLPYPASSSSMDDFFPQFEKQVNAAPKLTAREKAMITETGRGQLTEYFDSHTSRETIHADFARIADWAKQHAIPAEHIFLGEFGTTQNGNGIKGAHVADRSRWLGDIRQEAEQQGFHWALWVLNDAQSSQGMVLVSLKNANRIDLETATALGMSPLK